MTMSDEDMKLLKQIVKDAHFSNTPARLIRSYNIKHPDGSVSKFAGAAKYHFKMSFIRPDDVFSVTWDYDRIAEEATRMAAIYLVDAIDLGFDHN